MMEKWSHQLDFEKLGKKYGTPLYVFSPKQLHDNFCAYLKLIKDPEKIAFPIKTNPSLSVLSYLAEWGVGADAASMNEVKIAELAGIPLKKIIYNSPIATVKEHVFILERGGSIVIDSVEQLVEIDREMLNKKFTGKVFVRINPPDKKLKGYENIADWQKYTSHGLTSSKFGIQQDGIEKLLESILLPISGIHMHVGTQMDNVDTFEHLIDYLHEMTDLINQSTHHDINSINLGGGLGVPWSAKENYPTIDELGQALNQKMRSKFSYFIEPGNSLVGNTMGILTQVKNSKVTWGKKWGIIDVGSEQIISAILVNWHRQILTSDKKPLPLMGKDSIGGPLCFSGDILLPNTSLDSVKTGDYLFIQHCGSYCYAMSMSFNGRLKPALIEVDKKGDTQLVEKKEIEAFSGQVYSHNWLSHRCQTSDYESVDIEKVNQLTSVYLRTDIQKEYYSVTEVKKLDNNYNVALSINSPVDFISMPLALRIIGDLSVSIGLHYAGKKTKDMPVWGDELLLNANKQVSSLKTVYLSLRFSRIMSHRDDKNHTLLCTYSINDDAFSGTIRLRFECPLDRPENEKLIFSNDTSLENDNDSLSLN